MTTLVNNSLALLEKVKSEIQDNPSAEEAFTAEEEMRILIGLGRAEVDSEQLQKTIRNKLKRVARRAPAVAQSLLPYEQSQRKSHPASKNLPKS